MRGLSHNHRKGPERRSYVPKAELGPVDVFTGSSRLLHMHSLISHHTISSQYQMVSSICDRLKTIMSVLLRHMPEQHLQALTGKQISIIHTVYHTLIHVCIYNIYIYI